MNNLGGLAHQRSDLDRAAEYHEASLQIRQELAPGSLDVAASLNNLGDLARQRDDLVRAAEYHEASLQIAQELAPGSLAMVRSLHNLGTLAHDQWRFGSGVRVLRGVSGDSFRVWRLVAQ